MCRTRRRSFLYLLAACATLPDGGESRQIDPDQEGRMVYVDTVSAVPVVLEITDDIPAVQPLTGERTLMPGLYCPDCGRWYPVPAPDQINRLPGAARCPRTGTPLTPEGPWPKEGEVEGRDSTR